MRLNDLWSRAQEKMIGVAEEELRPGSRYCSRGQTLDRRLRANCNEGRCLDYPVRSPEAAAPCGAPLSKQFQAERGIERRTLRHPLHPIRGTELNLRSGIPPIITAELTSELKRATRRTPSATLIVA